MGNKIKLFVKILCLSVFATFLITVISNWKVDYNSLIGFIVYFYITMFCIKRYEQKFSSFLVFLFLLFSQFIVSIETFYNYMSEASLFSLPIFTLHLTGIVAGFLYLQIKNSYLKLIPFLFSAIFAVFMFFPGWDYWLHLESYGTFTGQINEYTPNFKFESFDINKKLITDNDFQNKIVLLDFWNTSCGVCFQKFPLLESFYQKHKTDNDLVILAVNKPIEEDKPNIAFEVIKNKGYAFPVVIPKDENMPEKYGVTFYPTTLIINKKGNIIFKGTLENAISFIEKIK